VRRNRPTNCDQPRCVLHLRQIPHHCLAYRITVANEIVKFGSHVDCNLQSSVAIDAYTGSRSLGICCCELLDTFHDGGNRSARLARAEQRCRRALSRFDSSHSLVGVGGREFDLHCQALLVSCSCRLVIAAIVLSRRRPAALTPVPGPGSTLTDGPPEKPEHHECGAAQRFSNPQHRRKRRIAMSVVGAQQWASASLSSPGRCSWRLIDDH
jgi:hypothetical protein